MNALVEQPRPAMVAGGRPQAIVPTTMDDAYRLAKAVCMAGMAPRGMDTPEKAMIAIMRGMEVGLTPFQALDKIAVVNGRPTIWGDGAMALVRGSGICEYVSEDIEGEGDARVAMCEAKRKGDPRPVTRKFSVADAKKAGLWGKAGPWQQFPERMLQMRARAFCLRDLFADVLGGLYLKEEIEDDRPARDVTPPAPPAVEQQALPKTEKRPEPRTDTAYADMGRTEERQEDPPPPPTEQKKEQPAAPARTAAPEEEKKDPPPPPPGAKAPKSDDGRDYEGLLDAFETTMGEATTLEEVEDLKQRAMGSWAEAAPEDIFEKAKRVYVAARKRVTTTKPADQPPADDPPPPAGDAGRPADPEKATVPVIPKMEDLEGWYQRGYDDFVAGLAFNKYPPVLKEDGYLEAKQSWMDGYSTAKKKAPKKD